VIRKSNLFSIALVLVVGSILAVAVTAGGKTVTVSPQKTSLTITQEALPKAPAAGNWTPDGLRSLAATKNGMTIYFVEEGNNDPDQPNKPAVAWMYKINLKNDGSVKDVQRSSYHFSRESPVDIALGNNDQTAYVTVEAHDKANHGIYSIDLQKAFQVCPQCQGSFGKSATIAEFSDRVALGVPRVHLRGVVFVEARNGADVLYVVDDFDDRNRDGSIKKETSQIWKLEYKMTAGLMRLSKHAVILKRDDLTAPEQTLFNDLFGIALDPIQPKKVLYLTTFPPYEKKPPPANVAGNVLLVEIAKKTVTKLQGNVWYGTDITAIDRNGTRWIFALAEGEGKSKISGEIVAIRFTLTLTAQSKFTNKKVCRIFPFALCHSIVFPGFPTGARGFIAEVAGDVVCSFDMKKLWEVLVEWGSYLSDIQESSVQVGWGSFHKDIFSKRGETRAFILDGKTYQKGLDTHAPAHVIYNLNGQFKRFQSLVGLWDSGNPDRGVPGDPARTRGSVRFIVMLDGQQVYDSGVMRWDTPAQFINIDVSGGQILELRVMDVDNLAYDWSIWADAKLLK